MTHWSQQIVALYVFILVESPKKDIMKRNPAKVLCTLLLGMAVFLTANAQTPDKFIGTWDQSAPDASGYEMAKVVIEKQSISTSFSNGSQNIAEDLKFESDTLHYHMDVDGEYVTCYLLVKDKNNLKGYATWSTGETDLVLTRIKKPKTE
jgi:hypothetical protein